jgi:tRNA (guanosine-2'-O-)-methyltransferase
MSDYDNYVLPERLTRFKRVASHRTESLTLVLDNVYHEHNISAVIRSADAFGLNSIHIIGERIKLNHNISLGSEMRLEIIKHDTVNNAIDCLKNLDFKIVVTKPICETSTTNEIKYTPVFNLPFEQRLAIVFGNELKGVNDDFLNNTDLFTYIPMFGFVQSLNVSVAAAICLFCSTISNSKPIRRVSLLNRDKQEKLVEKWLHNELLRKSP